MTTTTALLTLDRASILLPVNGPYPEVATINSNDGEIIKSSTFGEGFEHLRKHLLDLEYWEDMGGYMDWAYNLCVIADKQAFSFRHNGETTTFHTITDEESRTIELEPLDVGGILIGNDRQLPFGVYLTTAESYRVRTEEGNAVLDYRPDNRSGWDEVSRIETTEIHHLIDELAERAGLISLTRPLREEIDKSIEANFGSSQKTAKTQEQEVVDTMAAIATDTAFDSSIPIPAPLFDD